MISTVRNSAGWFGAEENAPETSSKGGEGDAAEDAHPREWPVFCRGRKDSQSSRFNQSMVLRC